MDQQRKLADINRFAPMLYYLALGCVCIYMGCRIRAWMNMLFSWESGYFIAILMVGYVVLSVAFSKTYLVGPNKTLTYVSGTATFIMLYGFMAIAMADIVQCLVRPFVTVQQENAIFIVVGFLCIIFVVISGFYGYWNASKVVTVEHHVTIPTLKKTCRVVLLSDLHIGYYVGYKHVAKIVEQVNALGADLVLISGDIINAGNTNECPELDRVAACLATMQARDGVYAVVGNHDPDVEDEDFQSFLRASNITLLEDEVADTRQCMLVGRTTRTKERATLAMLLQGVTKGKPCIVLDHDPMALNEAIKEQVDLVLCGHTHKGQIFPLNLFVRCLYSKAQLWGVHSFDGTTSVVSAGAGYFSMPMRIGSHSEVVCLSLEGNAIMQ